MSQDPDDPNRQAAPDPVPAVLADPALGQLTAAAAAGDGAWLPLGPGLTMKPLYEQDGLLSYLVRLAPGASLPPHRHPVDEECVVLEGMLRLGDLEVHAGAYHLGRQGVPHQRIDSPGGALIFLRGAAPSVEHLL